MSYSHWWIIIHILSLTNSKFAYKNCIFFLFLNKFCFYFISAIHNWHGDIRFGLPLDVGDFVEILEECGPWFRGTCPRKPRAVGLFPKSYIHLKDLSKIDQVVGECTQVLREWSEIWKKLFVVFICVFFFFFLFLILFWF